jgi:DNA polymerase-3 subunit delta
MRLRYAQFVSAVRRGLAAAYLVSGDEPMQLQLAAQTVREQARASGVAERRVLETGPRFDWSALSVAGATGSLFAERILVELRLGTTRPGAAGSRAIVRWLEGPGRDHVLLVTSARLDRGALNAAWVRAIEARGAVLQVWPLRGRELHRWLEERFRLRGLQPEPDALDLLGARTEGNLLAAEQEIEKLSLLLGSGVVTGEMLLRAVTDSARYDPFDLAEAVLAGDAAHAVAVLDHLRGEGTAPALILWALADTVRSLAHLSAGDEAVLRRIPAARSTLLRRRAAAGRPETWRRLLHRCAQAEIPIKRAPDPEKWAELLTLTLHLSQPRLGAALDAAQAAPPRPRTGP